MDNFHAKPTPVPVLLEYLHKLFGKQNKDAEFQYGDIVEVKDTELQLYFPASVTAVRRYALN